MALWFRVIEGGEVRYVRGGGGGNLTKKLIPLKSPILYS